MKEEKKAQKINKNEKLSKEEKKAKKAAEKLDKKAQKTKKEKPNKFIETIKKRWLINGTKTFILVVIILAVFIGISILMQKLNLSR